LDTAHAGDIPFRSGQVSNYQGTDAIAGEKGSIEMLKAYGFSVQEAIKRMKMYNAYELKEIEGVKEK